jgi:hypothetical protein
MAITKVTSSVLEDNITVAGNLDVSSGTIKLDGNYPTGSNNVALGNQALDDGSLSGGNNTAIGNAALTAITSGISNTGVGESILFTETTGSNNTGVGKDAMALQNGADNNSALGFRALNITTTGSNNTAVGKDALFANTTGAINTAIGAFALSANTTASNNTAVGYNAGATNDTGLYNTLIGEGSGYTNSTSSSNTMLGRQAGYYATGGDNTFIGYYAGGEITTGAKNTIIGKYNGNQNGLDIRTSSNNIVLSDGDGNPRMHINSSGEVGIKNGRADAQLNVRGPDNSGYGIQAEQHGASGIPYAAYLYNANTKVFDFRWYGTTIGHISNSAGTSISYNTTSDYRLKENIDYTWDATTRLKQLKPARFNFIADETNTLVDGFLAHEVQDIVPEAITGEKDAVDSDGNPEYQGIDQSKLVPLLVKTIQELEARITALES